MRKMVLCDVKIESCSSEKKPYFLYNNSTTCCSDVIFLIATLIATLITCNSQAHSVQMLLTVLAVAQVLSVQYIFHQLNVENAVKQNNHSSYIQ